MTLFVSLAASLALTELFELSFALCLKKRGRTLLTVALANLMTNPAVVYLHYVLARYTALPALAYVPLLEMAAVAAEYYCYKKEGGFRRPLLFSLAANAASYSLGLLIDMII